VQESYILVGFMQAGVADARFRRPGSRTPQGQGDDLAGLGGESGVNFTYISKIENQKLSFGEYQSPVPAA
jgi:hypothetical protein